MVFKLQEVVQVVVWRSLQCPPNSCRNPVIPAESGGFQRNELWQEGLLFSSFRRNLGIPELRPECSAEFTGMECNGILVVCLCSICLLIILGITSSSHIIVVCCCHIVVVCLHSELCIIMWHHHCGLAPWCPVSLSSHCSMVSMLSTCDAILCPIIVMCQPTMTDVIVHQ